MPQREGTRADECTISSHEDIPVVRADLGSPDAAIIDVGGRLVVVADPATEERHIEAARLVAATSQTAFASRPRRSADDLAHDGVG